MYVLVFWNEMIVTLVIIIIVIWIILWLKLLPAINLDLNYSGAAVMVEHYTQHVSTPKPNMKKTVRSHFLMLTE